MPQYFLKTVPSTFICNADETRVGPPRKQQAPLVVVSARTAPQTILTVPEVRDDSQLTLLTATSAFGDTTPPLFISQNKIFGKPALAEQQILSGHDYTI
jgi:hypothetical protein